MLVQQRDRSDQRQVLQMVTPGPCAASEKVSRVGERVDHRQRLQRRWASWWTFTRSRSASQQAGGSAFALAVVDRAGLLAVLVHGQDDAAVEQLLVHVDRRGREEDRDRPRHRRRG